MKRTQLIVILLLCSMGFSAKGQTATTASATWNNRVSRLVYMGDSVVNGQKRQHTLAEVLTKMVLDGKVQSYGTYDSRFNEKRTVAEMKRRLYPSDTQEVVDPVTGEIFKRIVISQVNYDDVRYFRVLEEWVYDAVNGTARIQITGLAPVKDEYGDDGTLRGRSAMYWVKYADLKPVLDKYEKEHPEQSLSKAIWENYFVGQ